MADRTSAKICGRIFPILARADTKISENASEGVRISFPECVRRIWEVFMDYDFAPYQAGIDEKILSSYSICSICGGFHTKEMCEEVDEYS